ncbi:hypothetical protein [Streptomyces ardesiacus]|uniref:hypothetical protein n=1 Tax=Streptomyces ardesiacus TaxID=285564 RepID=UPI0006E20EFA|nr:hypothetical protein [Streptomyces sp. NBRC 110030]
MNHRRASLRRLNRYLRHSERILASWDAFTAFTTDLDGWPFDPDAYGRRAAIRDADTAAAFANVRSSARQLLATARLQLQRLPAHLTRASWPGQLTILEEALSHLDALEAQWSQTRGQLPEDARPGTEAYVDALDEHHAECWSYLDDWACHGRVILNIQAAARRAGTQPRRPQLPAVKPRHGGYRAARR